METVGMLVVLAASLCYVSVFILVSKVYALAKKRVLASQFSLESGRSVGFVFCENCDKFFSRFTSKLLSVDFIERFAEKLQYLSTVFSLGITGQAFLSSLLVISLLSSFFVFLFSFSLVFAMSVFLVIFLGANFFVNNKIDKVTESIRDQIPEALRSMAACSRSGLSLAQTLEDTSCECTGVLSKMFKGAASRMNLGYSASKSLDAMKSTSEIRELKFIAVALDIQHTTGGSIAPILESARESVVGEIELARTLRVKTSQAKLSATIVTIMPFILLALFSLISPDFLKPLFSTPLGIVVFCVAMIMQFVGVISIRGMLRKCGA